MNSIEYSWNSFEQQKFIEGKSEIPSRYKIRIQDIKDKRKDLEIILEKLPQRYVAKWAFENARKYIPLIDIADDKLKEGIIAESSQVFQARLDGNTSAYKLHQVVFKVNTLSQKSINDISRYAGGVFVQAIATGHMGGHAVVSSDYAIKVMNLLFPDTMEKVEEERNRQIAIANQILEKVIAQ